MGVLISTLGSHFGSKLQTVDVDVGTRPIELLIDRCCLFLHTHTPIRTRQTNRQIDTHRQRDRQREGEKHHITGDLRHIRVQVGICDPALEKAGVGAHKVIQPRTLLQSPRRPEKEKLCEKSK